MTQSDEDRGARNALRLIEAAVRQRASGRLGDACPLAASAVELARACRCPELLGRALSTFGQIERGLGDVHAAIEHSGERAGVARRAGSRPALAHHHRHTGDIHQERNDLERAEPYYVEALALYRSRADIPPLALANILRPMAILRESQGRRADALNRWNEARTLYEASGVAAGVSEASGSIERPQG